MFEVGVSENVKNLEKVKEQLNSLVENYSKNKAIQLKVEIENLDAISTALSKIGDSPKLRELRQEIESLNREFSKLAAGAGGVGDLNLRAANQNVAELKENWQSANRTLLRYKTDLEDLRRSRDMQPVGSQARADYQGQIATFKKTVEEQQKIADAAKSAYDKAVKDAGQLVDANTRAEASYRELKSSIDGMKNSLSGTNVTVSLGQDFANWAKEVQTVTNAVKDLVAQLEKITTADGLKTVATSAQTAGDRLTYLNEALESVQKKLATAEERTNKYYDAQLAASEKIGKSVVGLKNDTYYTEYEYGANAVKRITEEAKILVNTLSQLKDATSRTAFKDTILTTNASFLSDRKDAIKPIINDLKSYLDTLKSSPVKDDDIKARIQAAKELLEVYKAIDKAQTGFANAVSSGKLLHVNQLNDLKREKDEIQKEIQQLQKGTTQQGNLFDPQKFTALQEAIDKIISEINRLQQAFTHLGENSSLSNLTTMINGLAVTLSSLSNAIKIQPLDEQVKALLERCEKVEAKLREVGDAAKYLNERAGAKTQQKAGTIMDITGTEAEQLNKVSSTAERFMRLLVEIENQMAKIGKIQAFGEQSGFSPTLLKNAQNQLEALHKIVESTFKGTPLAEGLIIPASDSQLAQFIQQFGLLKAQYKDVITEADRFNKINEKDSLKQKNEELRAAASNMKEAANESRRLTETISNLEALTSKAGALGIDTSKLRNVIDNLKGLRSLMDDVAKTNSRSTKDLKLEERFFQLKRDIKDVARDIKKELSAALKPDTEQANAFKEYISLLKQITSLTGTAKRAEALGIDTQTLRNQIALLENYAKIIERFVGNKGVGFNAWMQATPVYGEARGNIAADQAKMNKEITDAKQTNTHATLQLSESEQRLANAVKGTSDSMRGQSQVLSDLKMLATQYLSVWGAQSLVGSIIETGGLLEQQRLSLSAILGDMGKAQTLFNQIKTMALKSPFGVVELDKMSKQLAAYSFEYEELFEWTKRLADISAATGTSVDRLALALGHVRSEGALSGYTLRQFAMANVPVLRMLSENLGISAKEVRDRVRKKEISAEDVQDILKQLTEDGGMFANAQETMSEALNAKFKNLRDAFDIMYGEIAESGIGDKLKNLAEILTAGAKHWERLATDVKDVALTFGVAKVAMLMYNTALGKGTAITLKSALASKQKEIANLELTASYRKLTTEEMATMAMSGKLNSTNIATLLSTKKLTYAELERAVALGKVSKAEAMAALNMLGMHKQMALLRSVAPLQGFARVWAIVAYNIKLAGLAVKSFIASAWPLVALTGLFEVWNRRSEQKDNASDMAKTMAGNARGKEAYEMNSSLADSRKLSKEALQQNIEEMQKALEAANAYTAELKKQVDATDDLTKKYDLLKGKISEVADEYENQKAAQESMLNEAWDAGGGFLTDNMLEDTQQFDTAMAEYQKKLTIASKQIKGVLSEWLKNQGQFNDEYAAMTGKQIFESLDKNIQESFLNFATNGKNAKAFETATQEMLRDISVAYSNVGDKLSEMRGEQGQEFASILKSMYEEAFKVDLDKATQNQVNDFDKWLRETIGRADKLSNDAKEALRNIVIDFTVTLKPNYVVNSPKTPEQVVEETLGDNQWLGNFFRRRNTGYARLTEEAAKELTAKYKKVLGDISLSNFDTAEDNINKQMDKLEKSNKQIVKSIEKGNLTDAEKKTLEATKKKNQEDYDLLNDALDDIGGTRKRKGDKSGSSHEDKQAKELRERVRILKEAESAFQYWRKAIGDAAASTHVNKEFGQILSEQGFSFENIEKYKKTLEDLRKRYQRVYDASEKAGQKRPQLLEAIKEIDKVLADIGRKDFEKATEEFLSQTKIQLDSLTRAWDTFNSVREATGNIELAKQLSGVTYDEEGIRNLAEATRKKIEEDFAAAGAVTIPFDMDLSDKQIEDKVHAAFKDAAPKREDFEDTEEGLDAYNQALMQHESQIKGVIEETKKWRDLQRDLYKNDISVFTKAWNDDRNRYEQFNKAVARYEKEKQSLERLLDDWNKGRVDQKGNRLGIDQKQYERAMANLTSRESWAQFKAKNGMDWLTSNIDKTSIATVRRMIDALKEYAATTEMSAEETEAWFAALNKFTDREAILNPIQGITQAIENYNRAAERRQAAQTKFEGVKNKPNATPQQIAEASQHYDEAVAAEIDAFESLKKSINVLASKFTQFGNDLQSFGQQFGGTVGDIFSGFGQIFSSVGNGMNAIQNINLGSTGILKIMEYAQTAMTVVSSMIGLFQGVSSLFPSTESLYEHYAEKQKKVNQLREAVDNYRIAIARAKAEEEGWIGGGDALDNLREAYDIHGEVVLAYYSKLREAQEAYVESSAGIKKAIIPMLTAITAVAAVAAGIVTGGSGGVALWGLGSMAINAIAPTLAAVMSATMLQAVGVAVAAGVGAVVGQAIQSGVEAITYKEGQIDARSNMKVQTQHHTFFRSEKTQNLEEWAKENLGVDLFDKNGLINLEAAQAVLDSGATLVGETRETLEKLMELREQYDEWEKSIRDYVSDRFSGIADDMVNAIWDWLSDGENALDKFHEYASDTFKQIAQDAVKSFLKVTVLDSFQQQLEDLYKAYSMKDKNGNRVLNEVGLMAGVASVAGDMAAAFEATLPVAEQLAETIKEAFDIQGYDITNNEGSSSSSSKSIQSITEQTADLLAAYVNAIRADVSVIRTLDSKAVQEYWPSQIRLMTAGTQSLTNIESHTLAIMRSNDVIADRIVSLDNNINGLKSKTWSLPVA